MALRETPVKKEPCPETVLRFQTAPQGAVFVDGDGDPWVVAEGGIACIWTHGKLGTPAVLDFEKASRFGPFVRLVPERPEITAER